MLNVSSKNTTSNDDSVNSTGSPILSFRKITYSVKERTKSIYSLLNKFRNGGLHKTILSDVSGDFTKGMNAILGPSGCGKSSLLDILADRKDRKSFSGDIFLKGRRCSDEFRYSAGYVSQQDIYFGTLTVRENLQFSANLRLPNTFSSVQRKSRVSEVISELGLESCADTLMGTDFLRGVSGGEKKRTCIGMELILIPDILFLDEPTTGLDASTASHVMDCLKDLSKKGHTIIFVIHQPRYSIFKMFDTVMFMCEGSIIYQGPVMETVAHFLNQGFAYEMNDNPADFVLDLLIDLSRKPDSLRNLITNFNVKLNARFYSDSINHSVNSVEESKESRLEMMDNQTQKNSILIEIIYISRRTIVDAFRNPALLWAQIATAIILGLLVGIVFYDLQKTVDPGIKNIQGAIFFIVLSQIFSTISALDPLIKERVIFLHEYSSGYYRIFSYFIAKIACDTLLLRILPCTIFSVTAYFMTGLSRTAARFFTFLLSLYMATIFGTSLCFFITASTTVLAVALSVTILILTVMMVFSGFLTDLASIPNWISWLQWLSGFRYAFYLILSNELKGNIYCFSNMTNICPLTGETILTQQRIDFQSTWDSWKYLMALAIMSFGLLGLAFIQLIRIRKTK